MQGVMHRKFVVAVQAVVCAIPAGHTAWLQLVQALPFSPVLNLPAEQGLHVLSVEVVPSFCSS
jgi:hypothetical protein